MDARRLDPDTFRVEMNARSGDAAAIVRPSEHVTAICERLRLGCRPVTDDGVTEADWAAWLDAFDEPPKLGSCPRCGGRLRRKSGRYGEFAGCENYPRCRFTKKFEAEEAAPDASDEKVGAYQRRFEEMKAAAWESVRQR